MNLRRQLETLTWGFAEDLESAETFNAIEMALHLFSSAALPVIQALDKELTGKNELTAKKTVESFRAELEKDSGSVVVYLSDGGYSRLCIDPWAESGKLVGLDRSLSLKRALDAWDAMK